MSLQGPFDELTLLTILYGEEEHQADRPSLSDATAVVMTLGHVRALRRHLADVLAYEPSAETIVELDRARRIPFPGEPD